MSQTPDPAPAETGRDSDEPSSPSLIQRLFGVTQETPPETAQDAASAENERVMQFNLRKMRDQRVEDVMVPRADITNVSVEETLEDLVETFRASGHSRLPVYRETLDDPLGFVHLKDVTLRHGFGGEAAFEMMDLIRPILYAPPSMPIGALLQKMQGDRVHMALVIDEYGGVDGLVTIEDLLEQIVGEIEDEHDVAETLAFREEADGIYAARARADLEDFETAAGVDLLPDDLDEEVDTLGGLVFMLAKRIPVRGEVIAHPQGHEFEIIDADARRIKRLRVRLASAVARAAE